MKIPTLLFVIVALIVLGGIAVVGLLPFWGDGHASSRPGVVTLEDIVVGKFPSAADKQGTGGIPVTVQGLYVLYVHTEVDGDWHVAVSDGRLGVFITEITPPYQSTLGMPPSGKVIDETGTPYCDTFHENETWHGNTCWEIHPVTSWQISKVGVYNATRFVAPEGLNLSISYDQNPVARGSNQTITAKVGSTGGPVIGADVYIHVTYVSNETTRDFLCITSGGGACSVSWAIGVDSPPGIYGVVATVDGASFDSSFEVTT